MKRKSWLFCLLLAIIVMPCMLFLSACGDKEPSVTSFGVYIGETLVAAGSKTIDVEYSDEIDLESKVTVKLNYSDGTKKEIKSGDGGYTYSVKNADNEDVVLSNTLNVGDYTINISYGEYVVDISLRIGKKTPTMNLSLSKTTFAYGEIIEPIFSGAKIDSTVLYFDTSETPSDNLRTFAERNGEIEVGTYYLWASTTAPNENYNDYESNKVQFQVVKANHSNKEHDAFTGTYSPTQTLADFVLNTNYSWVDGTIVPTCDKTQYQAKYNDDSTHYNDLLLDISVTLAKATPTYTAPTGLTATFGDTLGDVSLASGTGSGVWSWQDATTNVGIVGTHSFDAIFTPTDAANYETKTVAVDVTVEQYVVNVPEVVGTYTYNGTEQTANIATNEAYTIFGNKGTNAGDYTATLTLISLNYKWADDTNDPYNLPWSISKATPIYTAPTGLTATFGDTLGDVSLASGTGAGVWSWQDATTSVGNVGIHFFNAIFMPTDTANYETKTVELLVTVEGEGFPLSPLEQLGFGEDAGIGSVEFGKWFASENDLLAGNVDLTVAQFNAIIANLNARYENDRTINSWDDGKYPANPNYIPFNSEGVEFTSNDWIYQDSNCGAAAQIDYYLDVTAYQLYGEETIRLVEINVFPFSTKFANDTNAEDVITIKINNEYFGHLSWGEKQGTYLIDPITNNVEVTFSNSTTATGKLDFVKKTLSFSYEGEEYNFTQKADFEVDLTTGIDLKLYDKFNEFNTYGKFGMGYDYYEDNLITVVTYTEWSEGEGANKVSYASMKRDDYLPPMTDGGARTYLGTYEIIFDVTSYDDSEKVPYVHIYNTVPMGSYYKTLKLSEFFDLIQGMDHSLINCEELLQTVQMSNYFFGGFYKNSGEPLTQAELAAAFSQTGEVYLNNSWFRHEGYTTQDGMIVGFLFDEDGNMAINFEGMTYVFPSLEFTDYPTIGERDGFENWDQSSFEFMMQDIYGTSGYDSATVYESDKSTEQLILIETGFYCGDFVCGTMTGKYIVGDGDDYAGIYDLILFPMTGSRLTGTIDMINEKIVFTYEAIEYTFVVESIGGGEGGGEVPTIAYESDESTTILFITHDGPTSGTFSWGELNGTFALGVPDTETSLAVLTIMPTSEPPFSGTYNTAKEEICFTYDSIEYTYTIVGSTGGDGGEEGNTRSYESASSPDNLYLTREGEGLSGTFTWGELKGTFSMAQQGTTSTFDLTITLENEGGIIIGTVDFSTDVIEFTHDETPYIFERINNGGESNQEIYTSDDSADQLIIEQEGEGLSGTFTWGELNGTFSLAQRGFTPMYDLTITLENEGGTINGTVNTITDVIEFTYESVEYTFENINNSSSTGGDGGEEMGPTTLFEFYNLPTYFKAEWTDSLNQTHTMVKVGDDVYLSLNSAMMRTTNYYKKQIDGTYEHWILNNESWEKQGSGISAGGVESSMNITSYFREGANLALYTKGSDETYNAFDNCRTFELIQEEMVQSTVWMHAHYDFVVVDYVGELSDSPLMRLNLLDITQTTFAGYGVNNLPTSTPSISFM